MRVTIRAATREDYVRYLGHDPKSSLRAVCGVDEDSRIVGMGGLVYHTDHARAFMNWDTTVPGKHLVRGAKAALELWRSAGVRLAYAIAKDEEVAPRFLDHFGFEYLMRNPEGQQVYVWKNSKS